MRHNPTQWEKIEAWQILKKTFKPEKAARLLGSTKKRLTALELKFYPPKPKDTLERRVACMKKFIQLTRGPSDFSVGDIKNLRLFATKLTHKADPISTFLSEHLDQALVQALATFQTSESAAPDLEAALVKELNTIISRGSIYDKTRFASVRLNFQTQQLLCTAEGSETEVARLNRRLLEDAYPLELSSSPCSGNVAASIVGRSPAWFSKMVPRFKRFGDDGLMTARELKLRRNSLSAETEPFDSP